MSTSHTVRTTARVVVAVDEEESLLVLCEALEADRFTAIGADQAQDLYDQADGCDLAVLSDGWADELPPLLARDPDLSVIVIGDGGEGEVARAIAGGAVDYLQTPFAYAELQMRIRVQLERREIEVRERGIVEVDGLHLDTRLRRVHVDGRQIYLAAKEYELLRALAVDPQRVWTKAELLRSVWGFEEPLRTRTLDSHASCLRRKLDPASCRFVTNCWGVGYRLIGG